MDLKAEQKQVSRPDFIYQHNPVHERGFQIMKLGDNDEYDVIGEYTILAQDEPLDLAEKKVMNLITLLNGRDNLMDLGEQTGTRLIYQRKAYAEETGCYEIIFYELGKQGVSQENALLTMQKEKSIQ
jgi:hypothetical protein